MRVGDYVEVVGGGEGGGRRVEMGEKQEERGGGEGVSVGVIACKLHAEWL